MRTFHKFSYRDADYRIYSNNLDLVTDEIIKQREILEKYLITNPEFLKSLSPVPSLAEFAPEIAKRMQKAGLFTDVGPMAAVAGTIAQLGVESCTASAKGYISNQSEAIVENGGDIFMILEKKLTLGIYSDVDALKGKLAFLIPPEMTPLAVCSSSSTMGHSVSLGNCNLATVFSKSAALADAAATRACNMVKKEEDIQKALNTISAIPGISGLVIIKGEKIGIAGELPEIVSNADPDMMNKITRSLR
ncbi:MAG: UPF0280 family protein [Spirochaetaceae bacterium]|nr:UPF0280 family protein [Spirochaetaceae bacterium]